MHELPVKLQMLPHDRRMNGMDLDDVIRVVHAILRTLRFRRNVRNECHVAISPASSCPLWTPSAIERALLG
jgi:hypothetical protein